MAKLFLGLDSSTQSLSAVVIDLDARKVIYEKSLNFDRALPHYKTQNGVLPNRDPLVKHSPPLMWADALDLTVRADEKGRCRARRNPRHQRQRPAAWLDLSQRKSRGGAGKSGSRRNPWSKISTAFSRAKHRPSGWIPRPRRNAPKSGKSSAASSSPPRAPARIRSSGSPARKSASFPRPNQSRMPQPRTSRS